MLIGVNDLYDFLLKCHKESLGGIESVFVPYPQSDNGQKEYNLRKISENLDFELTGFRAQDPLKILFYLFRESVTGKAEKNKKRIVAGIKSCDLEAIKLLDRAMVNESFVDQSYQYWRNGTYIITTDCTESKPSCHCNLVGGKPFVENGFDINLSKVNDYYFVKSGSKKGDFIYNLIKQNVPTSSIESDTLKAIAENHSRISEALYTQNLPFFQSADYKTLSESKLDNWQENGQQCVGCGGCTNICPTCYCLILNDESDAHKFVKVRTYDSCQLHGYARVAGGASPREAMPQRFRNRYLCKFCYMQDNFKTVGCTGCGRCIDACPAGIDFRKVIRNITKQSGKTEIKNEEINV